MIRFLVIAILFGFFYLLIFQKKEEKVYEGADITEPNRKGKRQDRIVPRGTVNITDDGRAIYQYYDTSEADTHLHQFNDQGLQGGGETWEGLILAAVQIFHPSIEPALDFDPEGDGIAIWSNDSAALDQVANLVGRIKSDPHFLDACLRHAKEEGYLE